MRTFTLALATVVAAVLSTSARGAEPGAPAAAAAETAGAQAGQDELERQFNERMTDVVLEGTYTTVGEQGKAEPDRYEIASVKKLQGNYWLFQARYGEMPLPPLPLKVVWAGDTPVISMNDFTIPKLGTFSFRVMIHRELYAGIWQHGEKGGHMTGTVSRRKADSSEK